MATSKRYSSAGQPWTVTCFSSNDVTVHEPPGWGFDISADAQVNGALYFGKGCADAKSWEGDFTAINIGAFGITGSFFWGGGWFGLSFGGGTGPAAVKFGATITQTTYVPLTESQPGTKCGCGQ